MGNFTRVKPAGYGANDPLTSAQVNQLDTDHAKSVNGDDGSTHTPADPVEINGPGGIKTDKLTVPVGGVFDAHGTINLDGVLDVQGAVVNIDNAAALTVEATIAFAKRLIERQQMISNGYEIGAGGKLSFNTNLYQWTHDVLGGVGDGVAIPLFLLHGTTLEKVKFIWEGPSGHASDPVDAGGMNVPVARVTRYAADGSSFAQLGTETDTVTTRASYEAAHAIEIDLTSAPPVVDLVNQRYTASLIPENSTEALTGGIIHSLSVTLGLTKYVEW